MVNSYESFRPQRLLFTKLDETGSFGRSSMKPYARQAALVLRNGQRIPEDLETA